MVNKISTISLIYSQAFCNIFIFAKQQAKRYSIFAINKPVFLFSKWQIKRFDDFPNIPKFRIYKQTFGVDTSKDVFDFHGSDSGHPQLKNDPFGVGLFLRSMPQDSIVVMEATGYYHYRLAQFLYKKQCQCFGCKSFISKAFYTNETAKIC